jgi:hypothetical protein
MDAILDHQAKDAAVETPAVARTGARDDAPNNAFESALAGALKLRLLEAPTRRLAALLASANQQAHSPQEQEREA